MDKITSGEENISFSECNLSRSFSVESAAIEKDNREVDRATVNPEEASPVIESRRRRKRAAGGSNLENCPDTPASQTSTPLASVVPSLSCFFSKYWFFFFQRRVFRSKAFNFCGASCGLKIS